MLATLDYLKTLVFETAPPLNAEWIKEEEKYKRLGYPKVYSSPQERQQIYAQECRHQLAQETASGKRDHALSYGIKKTEFTIPSSIDTFSVPILQLDLMQHEYQEPEAIIIYYHGGGLHVGEADSEELSCRRLVKSAPCQTRIYSIGYRLMPDHPASTCVLDALDGFKAVHSSNVKTVVVGSSSGGQLAAAVAQIVSKESIHGLLLRCPVTCDPSENKKYLPLWLRPFYTSSHSSFTTHLFRGLNRKVPRDGLEILPLEGTREELSGYPRTWIQLCTNDRLYSDGLCLAMALVDANVDVKVNVWTGWAHTFWLKVPYLAEALGAEESMLKGLDWVLSDLEPPQMCISSQNREDLRPIIEKSL